MVSSTFGIVTAIFRDAVASVANLPATGNNIGEVRYTIDTGIAYTWTGASWVTASGGAPSSSVSVTNFPTTQPVSGSVSISNLPATQAVSALSLPLPSGAATAALQTTLSGQLPASLGQKAMAGSLAVTFASDQSVLSISAASLPLPSGAATSALQTTTNSSLSSLDTKTPALGQALMAASRPVVIASNQTAVPVSGTFWQATQPVSGTLGINNFPATQAVSIASMPTTPVTGTFWQATQPVSIAAMPSTPVTGTFWQATQPVSGTVAVSNSFALDATLTNGNQKTGIHSTAKGTTAAGDVTSTAVDANTQALDVSVKGTVPVSGSFFQATQPVSIATMPTTPVTGAFFQATQPVSIATMPSTPVTGTFWQATQPVSGTVTANAGTGTMAVSAATLPLPTGAALDASVTGMSAKLPATLGQKAMAASMSVAVASDQGAIPVAQAVLTKGTQGANGVTTQQLKDAGRNQTNYFMATQIVSTATDTLMSLTGYKGGIAVAATTTPAVVTAAKTYRINSTTIEYVTIVTTPGAVRFTLRANTGGVVAITSPAVTSWEVGEPTGVAPVAGKFNTLHLAFPDGIEFPAGTGIGVSMVGIGATGAAAVVGYGKVSIHGYEY